MGMYTTVNPEAYKQIQFNAGVLIRGDFDTQTGTIVKSNIIGITSGGISFDTGVEFSDYAEDMDNVPNNTKQFKEVESYSPTLSGTFVTIDNQLGKELIGAADIDTSDTTHIIPRDKLKDGDFGSIWFVSDYSPENGGCIAIHLKNALNTESFKIQTTKKGKGTFSFSYAGHYDLTNIEDIPFEMYIKPGESSAVRSYTDPNAA